MAQNNPDGGRYGIDVGSRWRDAGGSTTVIVLEVQRSGVVVYRHQDAAAEEERVTNVVRFIETFAPAEGVLEPAYA